MEQQSLFNYEQTALCRADVDIMLTYRDNLVKFLLDYHELNWFKRQRLISELWEIQSWITINHF